MPNNPFKTYQDYVKKTPRNSFDMSWRNYLTLRFGDLVPCFVQDVTTGDSMSLDVAFALNFMPTVFPLQTPVRVTVHFFYVRYRNLWKHYEDFRYNNKSFVHPYIKNVDPDFWKTGSLADYLGVPTTIAEGTRVWQVYTFLGSPVPRVGSDIYPYVSAAVSSSSGEASAGTGDASQFLGEVQTLTTAGATGARGVYRATAYSVFGSLAAGGNYLLGPVFSSLSGVQTVNFHVAYVISQIFRDHFVKSGENPDDNSFSVRYSVDPTAANWFLLAYRPSELFTGESVNTYEVKAVSYNSTTRVVEFGFEGTIVDKINEAIDTFGPLCFVLATDMSYNDNTMYLSGPTAFYQELSQPLDAGATLQTPFSGADPAIRLNALPFRAYEQIYNSFYRNERVEPFVKDGEIQYNDFLTTDEDGADETLYAIKSRNWEMDFLTSALPSPQQGTAPIVGVDVRNITFQDGDHLVHYRYNTESDGETLAPGGTFEETDVSNTVRSTAVDLVASGFTINALRDANAMQIWLEKNIRKGLRYRDQHMSHTGVELDYAELDLPEFIGGISQYVKPEMITNMAAGAAPLGDYAGQLSAFGEIKHKISHFFREDGIVLGIMSVVPQPAYSQLLPKHFLRTSALDYFNPEFTHLGMQPITYSEVCPLQMFNAIRQGDERTYQTVFGYQRPNYDMVARVDEVHSQMRTTMRNFVMNRTFTSVPELGAEFLHVDPAQLNQVFQFTNEGEDTCFGQIAFKCFMKRPVPRVGEPRLEA